MAPFLVKLWTLINYKSKKNQINPFTLHIHSLPDSQSVSLRGRPTEWPTVSSAEIPELRPHSINEWGAPSQENVRPSFPDFNSVDDWKATTPLKIPFDFPVGLKSWSISESIVRCLQRERRKRLKHANKPSSAWWEQCKYRMNRTTSLWPCLRTELDSLAQSLSLLISCENYKFKY